MEQHVFSVTEVNQYIKGIIDGVPQLGDLLIRGELSNYKIYPSGHHYFTLKDGESAIRCVMFRGCAGKLRFRPESGIRGVILNQCTAMTYASLSAAIEERYRFFSFGDAMLIC